MNDPHFNIFYSYRGPSTSEGPSVRQLEDNLTRAVVVTLNHLRDSEACVPLLEALAFRATHSDRPLQCRLQVSESDPSGTSS